MKSSVKVLLLAALLVLSVIGYAQAADNDSHTVTVTVSPINELVITGTSISGAPHPAGGGLRRARPGHHVPSHPRRALPLRIRPHRRR